VCWKHRAAVFLFFLPSAGKQHVEIPNRTREKKKKRTEKDTPEEAATSWCTASLFHACERGDGGGGRSNRTPISQRNSCGEEKGKMKKARRKRRGPADLHTKKKKKRARHRPAGSCVAPSSQMHSRHTEQLEQRGSKPITMLRSVANFDNKTSSTIYIYIYISEGWHPPAVTLIANTATTIAAIDSRLHLDGARHHHSSFLPSIVLTFSCFRFLSDMSAEIERGRMEAPRGDILRVSAKGVL
jgi:hypothetical protein